MSTDACVRCDVGASPTTPSPISPESSSIFMTDSILKSSMHDLVSFIEVSLSSAFPVAVDDFLSYRHILSSA